MKSKKCQRIPNKLSVIEIIVFKIILNLKKILISDAEFNLNSSIQRKL